MRKTAAALLSALLMVTACGGGDRDGGTSGKRSAGVKVYRHAMDGAPINLDPVQSAVIYSNFVTLNVYDTLYSYKYLARPYELRPNLAKDFPEVSEDGLTYVFRIKEGVHFIDDEAFENGVGREVTAEDFVYSIKRHYDPKNRSQGLWLWQGRIQGMDEWKEAGADYSKEVDGLRALDRYTIEVKLTKPYPQLTYTFAMGFSGIVPHEAVAEYGRELSVHPVGSGPYKLVRFDTSKAVFEPNPKFRQEPVNLAEEGYDEAIHGGFGLEAIEGRSPPFVDRMEIDFIQQQAARWSSFTKGNEVQYTNVPNEQFETVVASRDPLQLKPEYSDKYFWKSGLEAGFVYTAMNLGRDALGYSDDPRQNERNHALRCAMMHAFDWKDRNERFYYGIGQVFPGVITPLMPEFDPEAPNIYAEADIDAAKALLKKHGWTPDNLPTLQYGYTNTVTTRQMYEQFRGFMVELGFPSAKIKGQPYATFGDFNKAVKTNQLDVLGIGWGLDYPDAENTLQLMYGPNELPGSNNSNMRNPRFDELYARSATMQPSDERTAIYREMNQIVVDECAAMSGLSRNRIYLWHKNVIGYPDREILGGFWLRYVDVK